MTSLPLMRRGRGLLVGASLLAALAGADAALFSDDEARKAILDLRQRADAQKAATESIEKRLTEENNQLRRSLLDLQNQIEALRAEQARLRGQAEQASRDIAEAQRRQAAQGQAMDERLRSVEPQKVALDGLEFLVRRAAVHAGQRRSATSMRRWRCFARVTLRARKRRFWTSPSGIPRVATIPAPCSGLGTLNMRPPTTRRRSPISD